MNTEIRVPTLGESVSEATIAKWYKKPGDHVKADEPLLELETDKVALEVNAPASGILADIIAKDGETVIPGAILGYIGAESGASTAAQEDTTPVAPAAKPEPESPLATSDGNSAPAVPPSPAAAKIAADAGIKLSEVEGSGRRGQVLKEDVLKSTSKPSTLSASSLIPAATGSAHSHEERVRMSKLRQTIAKRLKESQNTAAMLTTFNEVDMSEVMMMRARYRDLFEKKHQTKLGFMGFFVKACVTALQEIPAVNGEIDGEDIVYKNYYNIGIAVGTDKGLVVPVVRDADRLSLAEIEKTIATYGRRARDGQLKIDDMQGGTFTITNGGIYGSLMSTPILNLPQSGILGMHKIQERPVVINGKIEIRPMMYLALSYDHRIVDGKEAVSFLVRIKEILEEQGRLILGL